jgi:plastocyanin
MPSLRLMVGAAVAGVVGFSALGVALAAQGPAATAINIDNFTYSPPTITVAAGTTVKWTNADDIPHTVRAVDGSFHSKAMDTDDSYSFTFAKPGVYSYFCSIHPKMVGKVVVK